MLKTGIAIATLLLVSGCSSLMGPPPVDTASAYRAENSRLKAESAALRQALKEKNAELKALQSTTHE